MEKDKMMEKKYTKEELQNFENILEINKHLAEIKSKLDIRIDKLENKLDKVLNKIDRLDIDLIRGDQTPDQKDKPQTYHG